MGERSSCLVQKDDSLYEIARRNDMGINAISTANPGVDPLIPEPHTRVVIPSEWILPDAPFKRGIIINIAEMRLYYFPRNNSREVVTFPVGIGDQGKDTPLGTFTIVEKIRNPAWYVPASIRREKPQLPAIVPPGPDNPMGSHALRLSNETVLIHGTDRPWGIGSRDSHGCIRLYQDDIARLFSMVPRGTRVTIVNQPVKAAMVAGKVLMEVHDYGDGRDLFSEALKLLAKKNLLARVDVNRVKKACRERRGLPVNISNKRSPS